jgi:hypothetical protein
MTYLIYETRAEKCREVPQGAGESGKFAVNAAEIGTGSRGLPSIVRMLSTATLGPLPTQLLKKSIPAWRFRRGRNQTMRSHSYSRVHIISPP